jgi:hypothetical protein
MFGKLVATATLGGSLALGGGTVAMAAPGSAAAASSSATPTSSFNCANAPKALHRLTRLEARAQTYLGKATAREDAAAKAGHTKRAQAIARRISAIEKRESKVTARMARIEAACPGSSATSS